MNQRSHRTFLVTVSAISLHLLSDSTDGLGQSVEFQLTWGSFGQGAGQFHLPRGMAIDPQGNVFVLDAQNVRVQLFSPQGDPLLLWGKFPLGPWQFDRPSDLALTPRGEVAISQHTNSRVNVFTGDGEFLFEMRELGSPTCVAIDEEGYYYVGEGLWAQQIRKLDPDGVSLSRFGNGLFGHDSPKGIAISRSGLVIASDSENHRILVFDKSGNYVREWGREGWGRKEFRYPQGVATDASGHIYIADTGNHRIQVFSELGQFVLEWGSFGIDPGQFRYPYDLTVDPSGSVYVADTFNHRIEKFRIDFNSTPSVISATNSTTWGRLKALFR